MSNIYCGIGEVPKGKRLGSMKECAEKKQVRHYGLKKIDPLVIADTVKQSKQKKVDSSKRDKLLIKYTDLKAKLKTMTDTLKNSKEEAKKTKALKDIDKIKPQIQKIVTELKAIDDQRDKDKKAKE